MKPKRLLLFVYLISYFQVSGQLFYDDFEENISNDATFQNWTTENIEGWHYWHIVDFGAQHMRFEKTGITQDDWLISKLIDCSGTSVLKISFDLLYEGNGPQPELVYSANYTGNSGTTAWTNIPYEVCGTQNEWCNISDLSIETPGNSIYFAFHYTSSPGSDLFILLDNFKVSADISPTAGEWVGSSEHFEFYTSFPEATDFWQDIVEDMEQAYQRFDNNEHIPISEKFVQPAIKTKVYYTQKSKLTGTEDMLDIKAGYYDGNEYEMYLSPLDTPDKVAYYDDLNGLAINTFSQYVLNLRDITWNEGGSMNNYYYEGYGLYNQGYRPNRDSVLAFLSANPYPHDYNLFSEFRNFQNSLVKDIVTAYGQWGALFHNGTIYGTDFSARWENFLKHFYVADEQDRLMKYGASEHFDIYCTTYDSVYVDSMKIWLELTRDYYNATFELNSNHHLRVWVMKDEQMGMDITGYDHFNGGAGGINLSPRHFTHPHTEDGIEGYPWLLAHEIGHVYNDIMVDDYMWYGFHHEGMANLSGYLQYGVDWRGASNQIDFILNYYDQNFGRPPTLTEFYKNPHLAQIGTVHGVNPYVFGLEFYRMLYEYYGGVKIKEYFHGGHDCTVFGKDSIAIHNEYITRLKNIRNLIPTDTLISLPFYDTMESFENGWSRPSINNNYDNWEVSDDGMNGGNCMRFKTWNDKNEPIETWLVSPAIQVNGITNVTTSYNYLLYGENVGLDVFYTSAYDGNISLSEWQPLYSDHSSQGVWMETGDIELNIDVAQVYIGFRMTSPGNVNEQLLIDNFSINEAAKTELPTVTTHTATQIATNSAILNGQVTNDGGATITQRGFYWSATNSTPGASDQKETVTGTTGEFSFDLSNLEPETSYYYCAFATNSEGTATGDVLQFTTEAQIDLPACETLAATDLTTSSATLKGTVTSNGGATITQRGFYWSSTNSNPGSSDHRVNVAGTIGDFTYALTNLEPETTYYFKAFATNSEGTATGGVKSFKTTSAIDAESLPFNDDFEASDGENFSQWTTENLDGWQYWHVIAWTGNGGPHCMRFEICDTEQDDWLVTLPIDCSTTEQLSINFDVFYNGNGPMPVLSYTNNYTGTASGTNWMELTYDPGSSKDQWSSIEELVIDKPGEVVWFAFHYESTPQDAVFFLLDNFKVEEYVADPELMIVGSSEYFKAYVSDYSYGSAWDLVAGKIDGWYEELCSYWDRPGRTAIFNPNEKININLVGKDEMFYFLDKDIPNWKYGGFDLSNGLFLSNPEMGDDFYGSFEQLAKNTLGQYVLQKKFEIDGDTNLPAYFLEAFGLFYTGYEPEREFILEDINRLGRYPEISDIQNSTDIPTFKDLMVSYIEAQALSAIGIQNLGYYFYEEQWQHHFKYFYENAESERIKLRYQSNHFNLYLTEQDLEFVEVIADKLEEKLKHYSSLFDLEIQHKFNVVIYPTSAAGDYCTVVKEGYNGGSAWSGDLLDILSPINFTGGLEEALYSLIPHEFFHAFHFNFVTHLFDVPGFHSEGMAETMAYEGDNASYLSKRRNWFTNTFTSYQEELGYEPNLQDIIDNTTGYMSVYGYGHLFWYYMLSQHTDYETVKEFFINDQDWTVFDLSYEEIDEGYIAYLKALIQGTTANEIISQSDLFILFEEDQLTVKNKSNGVVIQGVELYSLSGQLIRQYKPEMDQITMQLPINAMFLLKVITNKGVLCKKLEKFH